MTVNMRRITLRPTPLMRQAVRLLVDGVRVEQHVVPKSAYGRKKLTCTAFATEASGAGPCQLHGPALPTAAHIPPGTPVPGANQI
jgi:hypothetical protein